MLRLRTRKVISSILLETGSDCMKCEEYFYAIDRARILSWRKRIDQERFSR